ncbi:hypothetical protein NPIL_372681 [Nephila pilipes]|uniref:Uncharacterized protein n=1 Tax=Nephila pilipes TaxID=299642 RepID=A0A8X6UK60_NEPPI|nr:hypothetical protein NPIL_372681 [Nephila pilipes]
MAHSISDINCDIQIVFHCGQVINWKSHYAVERQKQNSFRIECYLSFPPINILSATPFFRVPPTFERDSRDCHFSTGASRYDRFKACANHDSHPERERHLEHFFPKKHCTLKSQTKRKINIQQLWRATW